jgi:nicotinamidase-related amidase
LSFLHAGREDPAILLKGTLMPPKTPSEDPGPHLVDAESSDSADALLLIDVINDFDFPGGTKLLKRALPAARRIAALKARARKASMPIIYVNDNFGRWRSDFRYQVDYCLRDKCQGRPVVDLLRPEEEDYFVLKPMHSGFFSTTLEVLLERLETQRLILTGFVTDICVLYTANDAYMREYDLAVPEDCVAAETAPRHRFAIDHIRDQLKASVGPGSKLQFRTRSTKK